MDTRYPGVYVPLLGQDGNPMSVVGRVSEALRVAGVPRAEIDEYAADALSGDYDHVIQVTIGWVSEGREPKPAPSASGPACPECGSDDYYPGSVGCRACGSREMPNGSEED